MNKTYYVKTEEKEHTVKIQNKDEKFYGYDAELVENPTGTLVEKTISQNGEYLPASDNADGYSKVTVAVPIPTSKLPQVVDKTVTELTADDLSGATKIGMFALRGCTALKNVALPSSVTRLENQSFYGCNRLESVMLPNGLENIGESVFYNCSALKSITIPNSVTSIGDHAFQNCTGLTSVTIPESVTSIGEYAFYYCTGLTSVTIPDSVTSIGSGAFYGCTGLTSVYYTGDLAGWCGISFGSYGANPLYYAHNLYIDNQPVTEAIIPNSVTNIRSYAFYGCTSLTSITIPDSVTSIGSGAFYNCTGLTSITILATTPPTLASNGAFSNTNNCPIYVPAESVDVYKAATNWSSLADRIFAIQE